MENAAIFRRWFEEVWNQGKEAAIDELFAGDGVAHGLGPPGEIVRGPAAFKPFWAKLRGAFPDIHFTVDGTVSEGDIVGGRWSATMTHQGDQLGVPATLKAQTVTGMSFIKIANGKVTDAWNNWDQHVFIRELGLT